MHGMNNMRFTTAVAKQRIAQIKRVLGVCPMHLLDVAELTYIDIRTARVYMNYLLAKERVHVAHWERNDDGRKRSYPTAYYAWGRGENAPKPPPLTAREVKQGVWARMKQDEDAHEAHKRKRQIKTLLANPRRVARTAWIFGAGA